VKIAFIYDAVYPWVKGGVERRIYELSKRLAKRHEVHVFGFGWWGKYDLEFEGFKLRAVCKPGRLYKGRRRSITAALKFSLKLAPKLLKEEFDVLDCQAFPYFSFFPSKFHELFRRSRLFVTWHEFWGDYWFEYLGPAGFFGKFVERLVVKGSRRNIAVSNAVARDLRLLGVDCSVIPNGVSFGEIESCKASDFSSDVIFVGRLIREKNIDLLLESLSILKESGYRLDCTIIGEGPERAAIERKAKELGLEVCMENFLSYEEMIGRLKASKVLASPSLREGFGISVLEANACGIPAVVVKSDKSAASELIVEGKNGFLSSNNAEEFAEKLALAIENSKKMRKFCIEFAREFDWNLIAERLEVVYNLDSQLRSLDKQKP
jgi:glycosyltransferase involved in cell wall biosynthesis